MPFAYSNCAIVPPDAWWPQAMPTTVST